MLSKELAVFLDQATGDAFTYDHTAGSWNPVANLGLSHRDAAKSVRQYKPKGGPHKLAPQVYTAKTHEIACKVVVQHLHHWSMEQLPRQFVVPVHGKLRVDAKTIQARVPSFSVLASSTWGPLVHTHTQPGLDCSPPCCVAAELSLLLCHCFVCLRAAGV